jgi:uncharacterized protein YfbU (UPF0304 family)
MLTYAERLSLWNQYEILKHLDPEEAKQYERNQEILSSGYESFYTDMNLSIDPDPVSKQVCEEVLHILGMFRAINFACKKHGYTPKSGRAQFEGFDGNASTGHFGLARFLRRKEWKWDELAASPDNSHNLASLDRYRSMLAKWEQISERYDLTPAQIEEICALS